jgi:hypothetical protein
MSGYVTRFVLFLITVFIVCYEKGAVIQRSIVLVRHISDRKDDQEYFLAYSGILPLPRNQAIIFSNRLSNYVSLIHIMLLFLSTGLGDKCTKG